MFSWLVYVSGIPTQKYKQISRVVVAVVVVVAGKIINFHKEGRRRYLSEYFILKTSCLMLFMGQLAKSFIINVARLAKTFSVEGYVST